jgi:TorA maturation chaperone TorD
MHREEQIAICRLAARALAYPDEDFARGIKDSVGDLPLDLWNWPELGLDSLLRGVAVLSGLPLEQVQAEHTRLFINGWPHVACPPYESAYLEGELHGQAVWDLPSLYGQWGIEVADDDADHAGAELEFQAFLLSLATRESLKAARQFHREHLSRWIPRFGADVAREARLTFYRSLGRILVAALADWTRDKW